MSSPLPQNMVPILFDSAACRMKLDHAPSYLVRPLFPGVSMLASSHSLTMRVLLLKLGQYYTLSAACQLLVVVQRNARVVAAQTR